MTIDDPRLAPIFARQIVYLPLPTPSWSRSVERDDTPQLIALANLGKRPLC